VFWLLLCCCLVERTAGTMMQRMSDMLTRWLEGAMRRAENEPEADESQDQSDSSEHDSPSLPVPADTSTAAEDRVEASLQEDVANLRLSPSPVNDATERASEVVNEVLRSASREVEENVALSDHTVDCKHVDKAAALTDRTSIRADNLAASSDNDSPVDIQPDCHSTSNQDSAADSTLSCTLHLKPETDITNSGCTSASIVVDEADSIELVDKSCSFSGADVSTEQAAATEEEKNEAASVEKNPAPHS